MSSKRNLRNSVPLYLRLIFSVIFFVYSFVFLYFIQGDLLAEAQYVYSNGLTTYSILFGAIILTIVLLIVSRVMNILFHYPSELYVLSYLPSFLLLSVITSVNIDAFRDFTFGEWIWVFPLVLVVYFILILLIIPKLEHFKRKSSNNYFTKLIWKNSLIFLLLSLLTASVSNTNNVIYYELKAERLILNGKYDDVLEVGAKSLETSRRLTELRMYALAKTGRLCDDLFDYPQYYGVDGLLDISDTTESYYRFSSKNICKSMGAYCDKSVKSSGRYLQLMKEKFSIPEENCYDDWKPILEREKFADFAIISTLDRMHLEPALKAISLKYDLLLERHEPCRIQFHSDTISYGRLFLPNHSYLKLHQK